MKVNTNVKFSYNYIKGSASKRKETIERLNQHLFEELTPHLESKSFSLKDLIKLHKSTIPENKNIKIKRYSGLNADGVTTYSFNKNGEIVNQTIQIPIWFRTKPIKYVVTLIHENTHVLDALTSPKKTIVAQQTNQFKHYPNYIYNNVLYNYETETINKPKTKRLKEIKEIINNALAQNKNRERIKILNDMRYELEGEELAYTEQLKYANILKSKGYKLTNADLIDYNKKYWFKEKIELLKSMIFETIAEERKIIKERLNK